MNYYMNWVLTNAQIELIASDVSVVDYDFKKEKKKHKKGEFNNTPASASAVMDAAKRWSERYGEDGDGRIGDISQIVSDASETQFKTS